MDDDSVCVHTGEKVHHCVRMISAEGAGRFFRPFQSHLGQSGGGSIPGLPTIDFRQIRPHNGSQHRAFEELCYQLVAHDEDLPSGTDLQRHGAPDGGVEFLATLPDESVWAWQAKFLFSLSNPELGQLDKSVKAALKSQPQLKRFTFCLPYDRPAGSQGQSAMQKWRNRVKKWKLWAAEEGIEEIEFEYVGESDLLLALTSDIHAGRIYYWFQSVLLSKQWFRDRFEDIKSDAGPRYTPEIHVDLPISGVFDALGRTQEFQRRIYEQLRELRERRRRWAGIDHLARGNTEVLDHLDRASAALDSVDAQLTQFDFGTDRDVPIDEFAEKCESALLMVEDLASLVQRVDRDQRENAIADRESETRTHASRPSYSIGYLASEMWRTSYELRSLANLFRSEAARLINCPTLLLLGEAGTGKTHLFIDVAKGRLQAGLPSVVVLGQHIAGDDPWRSILEYVRIDCTPDVFLGALNTAAETVQSRAILFVDAMNESSPRVWHERLSAFVETVRRYPRVALALSCRTNYWSVICPKGFDMDQVVTQHHFGFADRTSEAVRRFFNNYGLVRPDFPLVVPEFSNPLFLKLVCETLNSKGETSFPRGAIAFTTMFSWFLAEANRRLAEPNRLDFPSHRPVVDECVGMLAREMLESDREFLSFGLAESVSQRILHRTEWSKSLLKGLIDEGVLIGDVMTAEETGDSYQVIRFAYQRLSDHLRAQAICDDAADADSIGDLVSSWIEDHRWHRWGIMKALAIAVPENFGTELFEASSHEGNFFLEQATLESLVWRRIDAFPADLRLLLNFLSAAESNHPYSVPTFDVLIEVSCVPDHPLNAHFLHDYLYGMKLTDRDFWWTTYLQMADEDESPVSRLIEWAWHDDTSHCAEDAALLCATIMSWFLCSSDRKLRDSSTKALVALLHDRLSLLERLLDRFDGVNDPYVAERLYAVACGCALIAQDSGQVASLARLVYEQIFRSGQPPTHILLREYGRGVIERAWQLGVSDELIDPDLVRPPYRSPWPVRPPAEDLLPARPAEGTDPWFSIRSSVQGLGDFHRYELETNVSRFLAPNQARRRRKRRQLNIERFETAWAEFVDDLSPEQQLAVKEALESETPNAWDEVSGQFTDRQARLCDTAYRFHPALNANERPITYDADEASRWIFRRVISLGWTPDRFSWFDDQQHTIDRRQPRRERIGKKYQWIALHELLGRIADHCQAVEQFTDDKPHWLRGTWELSIRDVDPSLLLSVSGDTWEVPSPEPWWVPKSDLHLKVPPPTDAQRWLQSADDVPPGTEFVRLRDRQGSLWYVLEGHYRWDEMVAPHVDPSEIARRSTWLMTVGYLVRSTDTPRLQEWMRGRSWMGRYMPEGAKLYYVYLGEYPWYGSSREHPTGWSTEMWESSIHHSPPVPILPLASRYLWEDSSDFSIEESVVGRVPYANLVEQMRLAWSGRNFDFVDEAQRLVTTDPSATEKGPSCLLVDARALETFLQERGYDIVWTVLGEKMILTRWMGGMQSLGRSHFSDAIVLSGNQMHSFGAQLTYEPPENTAM